MMSGQSVVLHVRGHQLGGFPNTSPHPMLYFRNKLSEAKNPKQITTPDQANSKPVLPLHKCPRHHRSNLTAKQRQPSASESKSRYKAHRA